VVEDDPEAALFTVHVLSRRGQFEVIHTADPAEALRLAALLGHADEYLEKPVRVDTLIATATALIGQGRRAATDAGL
jgi:DNA-binding response OmpR family regulator